MQSLDGIRFIGQLSLQDADVLVRIGREADRILEFGVGGSTHIFAQCKPQELVSLDTDPEWIKMTEARLGQLSDITEPQMMPYSAGLLHTASRSYDLVFVDGVDELRLDFAMTAWLLLRPGGVMAFHDTRRFVDFKNVAWVAQHFFNEIRTIEVNAPGSDGNTSNTTLIHKKPYEGYANWTLLEGKPLSAYGDVMDPDIPL